MRLIDADEFYRILENKATMDEVCLLSHTFLLKELAHILYTQPIVEERPKGKWIPVSERLPEKFKDVLCWAKSTARGGEVCFVGSCNNGCWFLQSSAGHQSYPSQYEVVAWMELPKPYKE